MQNVSFWGEEEFLYLFCVQKDTEDREPRHTGPLPKGLATISSRLAMATLAQEPQVIQVLGWEYEHFNLYTSAKWDVATFLKNNTINCQ